MKLSTCKHQNETFVSKHIFPGGQVPTREWIMKSANEDNEFKLLQANKDKNIERMLDNFTLEICKTKLSPGKGSEKVIKEQERYVMLKYITTLHELLGLESSIDMTRTIGNKELEKFVNWFMKTLNNNERIVVLTLYSACFQAG